MSTFQASLLTSALWLVLCGCDGELIKYNLSIKNKSGQVFYDVQLASNDGVVRVGTLVPSGSSMRVGMHSKPNLTRNVELKGYYMDDGERKDISIELSIPPVSLESNSVIVMIRDIDSAEVYVVSKEDGRDMLYRKEASGKDE